MAKPADQHRKCALVRRTTGRAARGCGLRRAQSRHCLWRDSFVIVDAPTRGFAIRPDEARELAETGVRIIAAANEQLGFLHPEASV
jgi:hypothetical protein